MFKTNLPVKLKKPAITFRDIEPNTELKFSKTDRAEVKRSGIALLEVIGPIHDALEEYAVIQCEHMGRFMDKDL